MELLIVAGVIGAWILLNAVILPRLGVPTCMSGACAAEPRTPRTTEVVEPAPPPPPPGGPGTSRFP